MRAKARFDVAQTLPKRELRESHRKKLIEVGERKGRIPSGIARYATPEGVQRQVIHQLGEDQPAFVHESAPGYGSRKPRPRALARSSR
jgi:predicted double-glycine peptidase